MISSTIWNKSAQVHFFRLTKLHEPVGQVQFVGDEKIYECLFIPNCTRKIILLPAVNNICEKISRWLSRRNTRILRNQGKSVPSLIWKQKIWLAICEFLFRDFPVYQFKPGLHGNFFGTVPVWIWPWCLNVSARHPPFLSCKCENSRHECPKTDECRDHVDR